MISLPSEVYKNNLLHWVYSINPNACDESEWELLKKVCSCYLYNENHDFQIDRILLSDNDKLLIERNNYVYAENKEIKARFIDVAIRCGLYKEIKLNLKRECSDLYLQLAAELHDCSFFVRSLLVRDVRSLWGKEFIEKVVTILLQEDFYPHWLVITSDRWMKNLGLESTGIAKILDVYKKRAETDKQFDCHWQLQYVEFLYVFKQITRDESYKRKALVHETFADFTNDNREPNTFYPNLHQFYQNAFNDINHVKKLFPDDWERIHDKLVASNKEFVEMLATAGVHIKYEVNPDAQKYFHEVVLPQLIFEDPLDVLLLLMKVPYYPACNDIVVNMRKNLSTQNPLLASCFIMAQVNKEGNTIGINRNDAGFNVQVHKHLRTYLLYHLWIIRNHFHNLQLQINEEQVFTLLQSKHSVYVNDEQLLLWAKAICAIVNGDEMLGAYALMPQIESILRMLAEEQLGDMTMLSNELQLEHTLGGILGKLKPYMSEALYDELTFFLVDGCDVNLRNDMLHGLIVNPFLIQKYSIYLLYIALNLFFREKKFLFEQNG